VSTVRGVYRAWTLRSKLLTDFRAGQKGQRVESTTYPGTTEEILQSRFKATGITPL
jgi:hypothetical protein